MTAALTRKARCIAFIALALAGCRVKTERPEAVADRAASAPVAVAEATCCEPDAARAPAVSTLAATRPIQVPDVEVLDQDGKPLHFYQDLIKDKIVAINFVFTTCTASCPLLGASFAQLQKRLGDRLGDDCALISISVDPIVDRPERLKAWAARFGRRPGWTLVTSAPGKKADVDALLKALQVYSPGKADHSQSVIVVDGTTLEGQSSSRIASADALEAMLDQALKTRAGRNYFTDTTLVDQEGRRLRFYSDLLRGKVVVICPFFSSCTGSCVVLNGTLAKLQDRLGDRLGKDVVLISLTVDPDVDDRARLAEYARRLSARPGWYFLTGEKASLAQVERKLGQYVEVREAHPTTMIVGNEATGLWLKHTNPGDVDGLTTKVEEALADVRDGSKARAKAGSFGSGLVRAVILTAATSAVLGCRPAETASTSAPVVAKSDSVTDDRIARGRRIYLGGESPSQRKITAVIGGGAEVPATLLACAGCHGRDGRGGAEGAIAPSDLTRTTLTRPYGHVRPDGRRRPRYSEALLTRAIAMGIDSGGATLDPAMPRYRLSIEDNADLLAYMERLGDDHDAGVTDLMVRIGVILPPDAAGPIREVLSADFDELNARGGVYHRRITLRFIETPRDSAAMGKVVQALTAGDEPVFALFAASLTGGDTQLAALAGRAGVPMIGMTAPPDADRSGIGRPAFFLLAGLVDQSYALARSITKDAPAIAKLAIVHGADESQKALAAALAERFRRDGRDATIDLEIPEPPADLNRSAQALHEASAIVLLGPAGRMGELLRSVVSAGDVPHVIIPGALADRGLFDLPRSFDGHIHLALPLAPTDQTNRALARFRALAPAGGAHRLAQQAALAAADVIVEGLRRAERNLTRDRFVAALEQLHGFETGLTPPITFGPNRRVGAPGAHPLMLDLAGRRLVPAGKWIDADGPLR